MLKTDKNIVFCITHGRTGTTMLTEIFKIFENTVSEHEPEPNYASEFPRVKENPRYAIGFLEAKLEKINSFVEDNYVETSNVFGKGYFIPLVRMGVYPKLIFLNRDFRRVADSLFRRGSFPMRTKMGRHFSADPSCPGALPIFQPESLTNYQICFWGVLDSYYRQLSASRIYDGVGGVYVWASANDLNCFRKTLEVGRELGLEVSDEKFASEQHRNIVSVHHNPNKAFQSKGWEDINHHDEELEVLDRIAFYDPLFIDNVLLSSYIDKNLASGLGYF